MDIEKYITSGILESYVLGDLNEKEMASVEEVASSYPKVRQEILEIREVFGDLSSLTPLVPKSNVKESLFSKIDNIELKNVKEETAKVIDFHKPVEKKSFNYWAAASIAAIILFGGLSLFYRSKWKETEDLLNKSLAQNQQLANNIKTTSQYLSKSRLDFKVLQNPDFNKVTLKGVKLSPGSIAYVYWNNSSNEVFLYPENLPNPPSDKQYQLWAIIDGKPVDAGIFDNKKSNLISMKHASGASAFAITLEPKGGKKSPTLEQMYVMGSV